MTITSSDFNDFLDTFPESTKNYVEKFTNNERGYPMCKDIILTILNKRGYNLSPIKGEFKTNYKLEELYEALILDGKKTTFLNQIYIWLFGDVIIRMLCYVLELDKAVLDSMRKSDPEGYDEIFQAMYLTGLKGIFN